MLSVEGIDHDSFGELFNDEGLQDARYTLRHPTLLRVAAGFRRRAASIQGAGTLPTVAWPARHPNSYFRDLQTPASLPQGVVEHRAESIPTWPKSENEVCAPSPTTEDREEEPPPATLASSNNNNSSSSSSSNSNSYNSCNSYNNCDSSSSRSANGALDEDEDEHEMGTAASSSRQPKAGAGAADFEIVDPWHFEKVPSIWLEARGSSHSSVPSQSQSQSQSQGQSLSQSLSQCLSQSGSQSSQNSQNSQNSQSSRAASELAVASQRPGSEDTKVPESVGISSEGLRPGSKGTRAGTAVRCDASAWSMAESERRSKSSNHHRSGQLGQALPQEHCETSPSNTSTALLTSSCPPSDSSPATCEAGRAADRSISTASGSRSGFSALSGSTIWSVDSCASASSGIFLGQPRTRRHKLQAEAALASWLGGQDLDNSSNNDNNNNNSNSNKDVVVVDDDDDTEQGPSGTFAAGPLATDACDQRPFVHIADDTPPPSPAAEACIGGGLASSLAAAATCLATAVGAAAGHPAYCSGPAALGRMKMSL